MQILHTVEELRTWTRIARDKANEKQVALGLVPTMGALHAGHLSLVRAALDECSSVVVSIFVNPTQFGPGEDFDRYPRTLDADCALLEAECPKSEIVVFAPAIDDLYPAGAETFIEVAELSTRLDGQSRPGHFRGVATVVAKLLIAAGADWAYFGQKDAAQVAVIRRLVADLLIPTKIIVCPIVREADGLAMSSRNAYLSTNGRSQALVLSRALRTIEALFLAGEYSATALKQAALKIFAQEPEVRVDFVEIVDWETLLPVETATPGTLCAVAAYVGTTRLIDNTILSGEWKACKKS
jgi:pantoate--beta-alanine ligase